MIGGISGEQESKGDTFSDDHNCISYGFSLQTWKAIGGAWGHTDPRPILTEEVFHMLSLQL